MESDERKRALARRLFEPEGKNPYMFNGKPINNMKDLVDYLKAFTGKEAQWVAQWLEYLGDGEIAERIRKHPDEFKKIVTDRYNELKRYSPA